MVVIADTIAHYVPATVLSTCLLLLPLILTLILSDRYCYYR